jgi:HK97 family phage major capsid protein
LRREWSNDGKALVSVDFDEIQHRPAPPGRSLDDQRTTAALEAKVDTLQAEITRLEAAAASHRADFERERDRAEKADGRAAQSDSRPHGGKNGHHVRQGNDSTARRRTDSHTCTAMVATAGSTHMTTHNEIFVTAFLTLLLGILIASYFAVV